TPFFPLVQSGLERVGGETVKLLADLELGLAQLLMVRLARQQPGEAAGLVEKRLLQQVVEALGLGFLGSREGDIGHERPPCGALRGFWVTYPQPLMYGIFHPLSRRLPVGSSH